MIQKNNLKLEKLKKAWFFKNLRIKRITKSNNKLEVFTQNINNWVNNRKTLCDELRLKYNDNTKLKKVEFALYLKFVTFYFEQTNNEILKFSEYEAWKTKFVKACEREMVNLESSKLEIMTCIKSTTDSLFKDIFRNNRFQKMHNIKVLDDKFLDSTNDDVSYFSESSANDNGFNFSTSSNSYNDSSILKTIEQTNHL